MNMKTLAVLILMGISLSSFAETKTELCIARLNEFEAAKMAGTPSVPTPQIVECQQLKQLSLLSNHSDLEPVVPKDTMKTSLDGQIVCVERASYTLDYDRCSKALGAYNTVLNAEVAMDLQQKIRTDLQNKKIQEEATRKAAQGDFQTGALDAGMASHDHAKQMNTEKVVAYGAALGVLTNAYMSIPTEKMAIQKCMESGVQAQFCEKTVKGNSASILANQEAKAALALAIGKFTAKALAAGIAMGQHKNASNAIAAAKKPYTEEGGEVMMERCMFNPTDPACAKPGTRIPGQSFSGGEFGFGDGTSNAFNMNPDEGTSFEEGAPTTFGDGQNVASVNSPFVDEAKAAQQILDPAAAAQMQASGGAKGGGGGGVGGGMGGGGASLGNDLAGAEKDANKEPSIKVNKVSGVYGAAGGGGFKGIGKGKEDANPFASLFDSKSNGGIEEDRSIASGDIDGKASGLFQKISKRYGLIHADKRIEARNLE
jgi:hypothetical protein